MTTFMKSMIAALVAASAGAVAATASADIVCNSTDNVCWHTHRHYAYKPEFGVEVHPNGWAWGQTDHYVWKEHTGRGYWRSGAWIAF